MSAVKLIFKRSAVLGKRPTGENLEPGEIGLNTNAVDPGLFFEVTDGAIVKAGPTSVLPVQPASAPSKGEMWYNTQSGELNIGAVKDSKSVWRTVAAPYLGGSANVVFVAPEFPGSTDSILNDGQTLPYQTVTRAILELSKIRIQRALAGATEAGEANRYVVYYAPSRVTANNGPGTTVSNFTTNFSAEGSTNPTIAELEQFNAVDGGIIIPAGISIIAMDLKKCELKPSYVPTYKNPALSPGAAGEDQPLSCIFKWSGNTYVSNFSISDKVETRDVAEVTRYSTENNSAVFHSTRPHGLSFNEMVTVTLTANVTQTTTLAAGVYYVNPIDTFTFFLTTQDQSDPNAPSTFIQYDQVPGEGVSGVKFVVSNVLYSAHRLAAFANATDTELADYYTKVQAAFPNYFGNTITPGEEIVSSGEYVIVGPTDGRRPFTIDSNTTRNSSAYMNQVNIRSNYGMAGGDFDGTDIEGFRSVIINASTVVSLQNDPAAYEVYTSIPDPVTSVITQKWWKLTDATYYSIPIGDRPPAKFALTREEQLLVLNQTQVENVRYYYETETTSTGESIGLTNIQKDFRHYGFRFRERAYGQLQSIYTIGCAVGVWALNGGEVNLTNSTSNFGSISFLSEAFYGINTIGGADNNQKGFLLEGFQLPLSLLYAQVTDNLNKDIFTLGARIVSITPDPDNIDVQRINLNSTFSPCFILPYSLAAGSAVWVTLGSNTYRAFFAVDGGPTVILDPADPTISASLRVRISDSNIPTDPALFPYLGIPYIRRFRDPRSTDERAYSVIFRNTSPIGVPPKPYSVLRLNQASDAINANTIRPNVQFDPGETGGWGRVFTVSKCTPAILAESPQFNYCISDAPQSDRYHVILSNTDIGRPWNQIINNGVGQQVTYSEKNWYAAENNYWYNVYYNVPFDGDIGPLKIPPVESCSPFVPAATLIRQEAVSTSYQGKYGGDPDTPVYPNNATYMRGYTTPITLRGPQAYLNGDDGTPSMGLCINDLYSGVSTQTVALIDRNSLIQDQQLPGDIRRYRPGIVRFSVLDVSVIPNPTQDLSIIKFTDATGATIEYFRVIAINGSTLDAIRLNAENSFYPNPTNIQLNWPAGTTVQVMEINKEPVPRAYDPIWANSKRALMRFMAIMGYSEVDILPLMTPKYWGERIIPVDNIPVSPAADGYAVSTASWPFEFNTPSSVVANTHTWSYAGYYTYSIGLPPFQNARIPRKLSSDFQSYSLWSGALAVSGVNEAGEFFQFGPQYEATTARFYEQPNPSINLSNQELLTTSPATQLPAQVSVYYTDNISALFDGGTQTFALTRGGLAIPTAQLQQDGMFVQINGLILTPGTDYQVSGNSITFTTAPTYGNDCQIRVVTSGDNQQTLTVCSHTFVEPVDGTRNVFTVTHPAMETIVANQKNTFVFLDGIELSTLGQYFVTQPNSTTLQFTFTETPAAGTVINARSICSSSYWVNQGCHPVEVYNLDNLNDQFNGAVKDFTLAFGGVEINQTIVNSVNLIVSLNNRVLVPEVDYVVDEAKIIFTEAPDAGSTSVLRIIANSEYLPCPNILGTLEGFLTWGPSIVNTLANEVGVPLPD